MVTGLGVDADDGDRVGGVPPVNGARARATTIRAWRSGTTPRGARPRSSRGGSGAVSLGLEGAVSAESYEALYGPGGARRPGTSERLVTTRRPGMELVISAHKELVAELGVIGRAEDMHAIMDAERDATLGYLDQITLKMGGRRGRAAKSCSTGGLITPTPVMPPRERAIPPRTTTCCWRTWSRWPTTRGGWKAADTTLWREHLHAATMVGRLAGARAAVSLGYGIEPDPGPSGRLGHWRIAGIPDVVLQLHSKRSAEIEAECERRGEGSYRARGVAARTTRRAKEHEAEGELVWPLARRARSSRLAGRAPGGGGRRRPRRCPADDAQGDSPARLGDPGR